jgi:TRAP-type C4-dicarboxylate transport system permease small subunit
MRKVLNALGYLEETLVGVAVLVVVVIDFVQIVTRELGIPTGQAQEVMLLMFVWITFLGIPIATKRKAHLGLSLVVDALPRRLHRIAVVLSLGAVLFFLACLGYFGVEMAVTEYRTAQETPALGLPLWPFGAVVPLSVVLTTIRFLEVAYDDLFKDKLGHGAELKEMIA